MFELSSEDKKAAAPRLSVWIEALTVADEAWDFMGRRPDRTVVACLSVDRIRAIDVQPGFYPLDVQWEQALTDDGTGNKVPNSSPGAAGHCGVLGLNQGGEGRSHKNQRKALRSALADIADLSPVPVPHDLPESHLRLAAYFIFEKDKPQLFPPEAHWVMAIRQLRRARVAEYKAARAAE